MFDVPVALMHIVNTPIVVNPILLYIKQARAVTRSTLSSGVCRGGPSPTFRRHVQGVKLVRSGPAHAAAKTIDCTSQHEIVSARTWRHPVTDAAVAAEDIDHRGLDLSGPAKFSGVRGAYVVPAERAAALRGGGVRGPYPSLTLLKFVPREALTMYHQVPPPRTA